MGRKKQLLSLILAMAMLFSCVSPMNFASAEDRVYTVEPKYLFGSTVNNDGDEAFPIDFDTTVDTEIKMPTATKDGYGFDGWTYSSGAVDKRTKVLTDEWLDVAYNEQYSDVNIDIYPVFGKTVIWDFQGGVDSNDNIVQPYEQFVAAGFDNSYENSFNAKGAQQYNMTDIIRYGYDFSHWSEEAEGTTNAFESIWEYVPTNEEATLYAVWEMYTDVIEYVGGGDVGNPATYTADMGEIDLNDGEAIDGYVFKGWYRNSGRTDEIETLTSKNIYYCDYYIDDMGTVDDTDDTFVSLIFSKYIPGAVFDDGITKNTVTDGSIPEASEKNGYVFKHWYAKGDDTKTEITSGYEISTLNNGYFPEDGTDTVKVYEALYAPVYTFNANGGSWSDNDTSKTSEEIPAEPSKDNMKFIGWNTAADGSGTSVTDTSVLAAGETVYAQWEEYPGFDPNGGIWDDNSATVQYGIYNNDAYHFYDTPSNGYKQFIGWYDTQYAVDAVPDNVLAATTYEEGKTYYAGWKTVFYGLEYENVFTDISNPNPVSYTKEAVSTSPIELQAVGKDGYGFDGWYYSNDNLRSEWIDVVEKIEENTTNYNPWYLRASWHFRLGNESISGTVGETITPLTLALTDESVTDAVFSIGQGELPEGLTLANNTISGTPTETFNDTVYVNVTATSAVDVKGAYVAIDIKEKLNVETPTTNQTEYDPAKTLADVEIIKSSNNGGTWTWVNSQIVPTVGNSGYQAIYSPSAEEDENYNYTTEDLIKTVSLTVTPKAVTVATPTVDAVEYDPAKTLANVTLQTDWAWNEPTTVPTVGNSGYQATYSPEDTTNYTYDELTKTVALTVTPKAVTVEAPTVDAVEYDPAKTLANVTLPTDWSWNEPTTVPTVGNSGYQATYSPEDTTNYTYDELTKTVALTVTPKSVTVATPTVDAVEYDPAKTLANVTLPTDWSWDEPTTVPTVGNSGYQATYSPEDTTNYTYDELTKTVALTVTPKSVTVATPTVDAVEYDPAKTLANVTLPTDWAWNEPTTVPTVGNSGYQATYSPEDTTNYAYDELTKTVALTVMPADGVVPPLEVPEKVQYANGMTLADISVNDRWSWNNPGQAVVAGINTADATYTPEDVVNYKYDENELKSTAQFEAEEDKTEEPEKIIFPVVEGEIPYGTKLNDIPLTGGSGNGTFAWKNPEITVEMNNSGYLVVFTPATSLMSTEENPYEKLVMVNVVPATPTVDELPEASSIYTKEKLSESKLTGGKLTGVFGEEITGTFTWIDGEVVYSDVGTYNCEAVFTPESENYESITVEVEVAVKKKSTGSGGGGGGVATKYTITATANEGGTITPAGATRVIIRQSQEYTIKADEGYEIAGVKVDGNSVETDGTYKFEKVLEDHTIDVTFRAVKTPEDSELSQEKDEEEDKNIGGIGFNRKDHIAYINGYDGGLFLPSKTMTRAEAAVIICRVLSTPIDEKKNYDGNFSDVADNHWAKNYIGYIKELGIITGYEDGTFCPEQNISRAEFLAIVSRIDGVQGVFGTKFSDVADNHWAKDYIGYAFGNGWVNGYEDGTFRPDNSITRSEAVKMMNRVLDRNVDEAGLRDFEVITYNDVTPEHWAYYELIEASNSHTYTYSDDGSEVWNGVE